MQPSESNLLDRLATLEATVRQLQRRRRDRRALAALAMLAVLTGLTLGAQSSIVQLSADNTPKAQFVCGNTRNQAPQIQAQNGGCWL